MYQIGDRVVYGMHGVCTVTDVEEKVVDRVLRHYLVLEPVGQPGARFLVPTYKEAALAKVKKLLSRQELEALVQSDTIRSGGWIREENQRKQTYRELIGSGDRERLMAMVHTLYRHRKEQTAAGKKVHLCDENFLRDAEKLLISEVAAVLELDQTEAKQYLREMLKA